jgi:3-mercaptopyruvate sulfurtransferase SseA
MRVRSMVITLLLGVSLTFFGLGTQLAAATSPVPTMTKEALKAALDNPNVVIVDVRLGKDWKASESKIKGAIRVDADLVPSLADQYPKDKTLVFYCA